MKNLLFILSLALFLSFSAKVYAEGNSTCQIVYGGGEVCPKNVKFTINKLIQNPLDGQKFVENLTLVDSRFTVGKDIIFQIKVKNTGSEKIDKIELTDALPSELLFVSGPGTYDSTKHTITIFVDSLEASKEAVYFINTQVVRESSNCTTNTVFAKINNGTSASDSVNFCLESSTSEVKPKVEIKSIPETGPEVSLLATLPALLGAGFYLRKKSNN